MKLHRHLLIVCLCLVVSGAGCTVNFSVNAEREEDLGSHHVIIRPGDTMTTTTESTFGDEATYEFTCGDVKVHIENEALSVNGKSYGMLEPGQEVIVDHGTVSVAGEVRQPVADSQADAPQAEPAESQAD